MTTINTIYFGGANPQTYEALSEFDTNGDEVLDEFELVVAGDQVMDVLVGRCAAIAPMELPGEFRIVNIASDECKAEQTVGCGDDKVAQCSDGMTFVAAGDRVPDAFCVDNEATLKVNGEYPIWQEAKDFCEAAGKFLLSYEQHRLAAKSTSSEVVKNSRKGEWVLNSNFSDRAGQLGGLLDVDSCRHYYDGYLYHDRPGKRSSAFAFRCGASPSPQ